MKETIKQKTVLEWFEQLPEPVRIQATSQTSYLELIKCNCIGSALSIIDWTESKESYNYWDIICELAEKNQFDADPTESIQKFIDYIQDNLNVWLEFEKMCLNLINNGYEHYSARTLIHVIRYQTHVGEFKSKYKVNDHISPVFARVFMILHPQHDGFFTIKTK